MLKFENIRKEDNSIEDDSWVLVDENDKVIFKFGKEFNRMPYEIFDWRTLYGGEGEPILTIEDTLKLIFLILTKINKKEK